MRIQQRSCGNGIPACRDLSKVWVFKLSSESSTTFYQRQSAEPAFLHTCDVVAELFYR
jgi:hypothetical protein